MGFFQSLAAFADYCWGWITAVRGRQVGWKTWNRKTGEFLREQQPLWKKLKLLVLFNPMTEWIDTTHAMRLWIHRTTIKAGVQEGEKRSKQQIKPFIDFYNIDMSQFDPSDIDDYENFEDFFVRHHKAESRPIFAKGDSTKAVVVADSRLVTYETLEQTKSIWIKGKHFTMDNLLQDVEVAGKFQDAAIASFRLSPQDYHRFHSPVSGTVTTYRKLPGEYYNVDPIVVRSGIDVLTRNTRCWISIDTKEFGTVVFVAIGATDVGSVQINEKLQVPGAKISKGDEVGYFQFGGSSIVVAFMRGAIQFDEDLRTMSKQAIAVDVEVGMSLGVASTRL